MRINNPYRPILKKLKQNLKKKKDSYEAEWGQIQFHEWQPFFFNTIKLNFTLRQLILADTLAQQKKLAVITKQGAHKNHFASESRSDDRLQLSLTHLTSEQEFKLGCFALRLIDFARQEMSLPVWSYNAATQVLTQKIALLNKANNLNLAVLKAAHQLRLQIKQNQIALLLKHLIYGNGRLTCTQLKRQLFSLIRKVLFGQIQDRLPFTKAKRLLSPFAASFACVISCQHTGKNKFLLKVYLVMVTDGLLPTGLAQFKAGARQVSQANHGSLQPGRDLYPELKQQLFQLCTRHGQQLNKLNKLKIHVEQITTKTR